MREIYLLDKCQNSCGESDPILQCRAKCSSALSPNSVQLPSDSCCLAHRIEAGSPSSGRKVLGAKCWKPSAPISVGSAGMPNTGRGGTKFQLLLKLWILPHSRFQGKSSEVLNSTPPFTKEPSTFGKTSSCNTQRLTSALWGPFIGKGWSNVLGAGMETRRKEAQ